MSRSQRSIVLRTGGLYLLSEETPANLSFYYHKLMISYLTE
uniref:Uncharacterized protein n=2 Tax=Lepeophtheirus salmonis TaxID=72036 RepID=A0A0K2TQX6_LEPSM